MARYRKISPCIWLDAKVRGLSDKGKLTLFLLLTHPNMTSLGALRANIPGLACELGWKPSVLARAFRELLDCGMCRQDAGAQLIWFPNFLKHNAPESPNVVRGWAVAFEELPECAMKQDVLAGAWAMLASLSEAFREAFREVFGEVLRKPSESLSEAFGQPFPNQEQEQEQEQEKKTPSPLTSSRTPEGAHRGEGEHSPERSPARASGKACRTPDARLAEALPEASAENLPPARRQGKPRTDCPSKGHPQWPAFLSCFQIYPVKQGEEEAWREWMRLHSNGTLEQPHVIRDKILELAAHDSRWQRGKIPTFARWLNGKRWNDEPFSENSMQPGEGTTQTACRAPTEFQQRLRERQTMLATLHRDNDEGEHDEDHDCRIAAAHDAAVRQAAAG